MVESHATARVHRESTSRYPQGNALIAWSPYTPKFDGTELNGERRKLFIAIILAITVAVIFSATYLADLGRNNGTTLPQGCTKPVGGFLIIASNMGYNNSIGHGAPTKPWPIISVRNGSMVNIAVCNVDRESHGFQIARYFDAKIESLAPGQVIKLSFVPDEAGIFEIKCSIPCAIHLYMQNGELLVTS